MECMCLMFSVLSMVERMESIEGRTQQHTLFQTRNRQKCTAGPLFLGLEFNAGILRVLPISTLTSSSTEGRFRTFRTPILDSSPLQFRVWKCLE
jgi:hypothetical protein